GPRAHDDLGGAPAVLFRPHPHGGIEQAGIGMGQAEMLSESLGERAFARGRGAIDGNDQRPPAHAASILAPSRFISWTKPGKLVSIGEPSSTATGSRAASPSTRNDMATRWSRRVATRPPPGGGAPLPWTTRLSAAMATAPPFASRPAATLANRSLSFARSSARPSMRVLPCAQEAATARMGYSSIIDGARSAGTSTPLRSPPLTRRSATGSPPTSRLLSKL